MKRFFLPLALSLCGGFYVSGAAATPTCTAGAPSAPITAPSGVDVYVTSTLGLSNCDRHRTSTDNSLSDSADTSVSWSHSHAGTTISAKRANSAIAHAKELRTSVSTYGYDFGDTGSAASIGNQKHYAKAQNQFVFTLSSGDVPLNVPYRECSTFDSLDEYTYAPQANNTATSVNISGGGYSYTDTGSYFPLQHSYTRDRKKRICNQGYYTLTSAATYTVNIIVSSDAQGWYDLVDTPTVQEFYGTLHSYIDFDVQGTGISCTSDSGDAVGCEMEIPPDEVRTSTKASETAAAGGNKKGTNPDQLCELVGGPINYFYGYKHKDQIDYVNGILSFTRNYRSDRDWITGKMGKRWRHNFEGQLVYAEYGSSKFADVVDSSGAIVMFYKVGTGDWTPYYDDVVSTLTGDSTNGFTYTTVNDTKEIYNGSGELIRIEYQGYEAVDLSYVSGRLDEVSNEHGQSLEFSYNSDGYISSVVTPTGTFTYTYDEEFNLETVTKPDTNYITYVYEDSNWPHALTSIEDERIDSITGKGKVIGTYTYDATTGKALTTSAPITTGGSPTNSTYTITYVDEDSTKVTNPLGKETTYHFTTINGLRKLVEVEGHVSTNCAAANKYYTYTAEGWIKTKKSWGDPTNWDGSITTYNYDSSNRVNEIIEDDGGSEERDTDITYIGSTHLVNTITRGDLVIDYDYDSDNRIEKITYTDNGATPDPESREHEFQYFDNTTDGNGNTVLGKLKKYIDPKDYETDYTYDTNGFLKTVTNEKNHVWTIYARDTAGRITEIIDPNGTKDKIEYDSMGRVEKYTQANNRADPIKGATTYYYNEDGALYRVNQANGVYIKYFYDEAGRLEQSNSQDDSVYYYFDPAGNVLDTKFRKVAGGSPFTYGYFQEFDELSRLIEHHNTTNSVSYEYDLNSNVTSIADGNDKPATFSYDPLNRLISSQNRQGVINGSGDGITEYSYSELDDLLGVDFTSNKDSAGNSYNVSLETTYSYNAFGEVESETSPDRGTTTYDYDANGNLIERIDAAGREVNYTYDEINRLTSIVYPNQTTLNVTLTYDTATGCGAGHEGRLCQVSGDFGTINYVYDDVGRVTSVTKTPSGASFSLTTTYEYDAANYLVGITYPSGREVTYDYDNNGNVIEVIGDLNSTATTLADNMVYMAFGPVESMDYGNGHSETSTYDDAYWLLTREVTDGTIVMDDTYTYDNNGNLRTYTDQSSTSETLSYTRNDELRKQANYSYELDGAGNRTRKYWLSQNIDIAYIYDDLGTGYNTSRIEEIDDLYGSSSAYLTLDDAGLMEDYGGIDYYWDEAGRLKELKNGSTTIATYKYDPQNQRFSKTVGSDTTYYVYSNGKLLGEYDDSGVLLVEYVYLNGRPLAQVVQGVSTEEITYFHVDHQGTPRVGTDSTGASVWTWSYLGNAFGDIAPSGSVTVNLRFAGQYYDSESELFYNWNRYYDPATGRYVSSDPIGLAGGLNTFAYAGANPALYTDPEGLCGGACIGVIITGILVAVDIYDVGSTVASIDPYDAASVAGGALACAAIVVDPTPGNLGKRTGLGDAAEDAFEAAFRKRFPDRKLDRNVERTDSRGEEVEIDFETDEAIIEIKSGRGEGLVPQIKKRVNDKSLNPEEKVCIGLACKGMPKRRAEDISDAGGIPAESIEDVLDVLE